MAARKCFDCGKPADDTCPLCGLSFCRLCAEREGESCCDKAEDMKASPPAPASAERGGG